MDSGITATLTDPVATTSGDGLSGGAIAGIVAALLSAAAAVAVAVWYVKSKRNYRNMAVKHVDDDVNRVEIAY